MTRAELTFEQIPRRVHLAPGSKLAAQTTQGLTWATLRRRFMGGGWRITDGQLTLFNPATTTVTRYRRRHVIPSPWTPRTRRLAPAT